MGLWGLVGVARDLLKQVQAGDERLDGHTSRLAVGGQQDEIEQDTTRHDISKTDSLLVLQVQ